MDNNNTKYTGNGYLECICKGDDNGKIGESFHNIFVGDEDYINSNIIVNVSKEDARILLFDNDINPSNKSTVYAKTASVVSKSDAKEIILKFTGKTKWLIDELYNTWCKIITGFNHQLDLKTEKITDEEVYTITADITTDVRVNSDDGSELVGAIDFMISSVYIDYSPEMYQ